jgi:hypothetical protein
MHGLAVALARVAQHETEDMAAAPLSFMVLATGAGAVVDLHLLPGLDLDAAEGQLTPLAEPVDIAPHRMVLAAEALFVAQILEDSLRRKPLFELGQNGLAIGLAQASRTLRRCVWRRAGQLRGGRFGIFWVARPGGRFAGGRFGIL